MTDMPDDGSLFMDKVVALYFLIALLTGIIFFMMFNDILSEKKKHTLIFISRQGMVAIPGYSTEQSCLGTVNEINSNPDLRSYCVGID